MIFFLIFAVIFAVGLISLYRADWDVAAAWESIVVMFGAVAAAVLAWWGAGGTPLPPV